MNDKRRAVLSRASHLLDEAVNLISTVSDDEQNALDNMPENLQGSSRCEKMEDAISLMEDAIDGIEDAKEKLSDASG